MSKELSIKREMSGNVEEICTRVTQEIQKAGFGVLSRIDFDQKMKEKLGEIIPKTVILGACNPRLAFQAYKKTTDVALLIPCNIVVRELSNNRVAIEAIRPSQMLEFLPEVGSDPSIDVAEKELTAAIERV